MTTEHYDVFISQEIYKRTLVKIHKHIDDIISTLNDDVTLEERGEERVFDIIHQSYLDMRDSSKLIKNLLGKTIENFDDLESRKQQYSKYNKGKNLKTHQRELITGAIQKFHFNPLKDTKEDE